MEWTYSEEDLKKLLCPAFRVISVKFDAKNKQLVLEIELPDMGGKKLGQISKLTPGPSYQ
jgi:hypothetical protein